MNNLAIILLGSNLGDRAAFLEEAKRHLFSKFGTPDQSSAIYESGAWGKTEQSDYLNQVIGFYSTINPVDILKELLAIELEMGRTRIAQGRI